MRKGLLLSALSLSLFGEDIVLESIAVNSSKIETQKSSVLIREESVAQRRDITLSEKLSSDVAFSYTTNAKGELAVSFRGLDFKTTRYVEDGIPLYSGISGVDSLFMMNSGSVSFSDGSGLSSLGVSSMGAEVQINQKLPKKSLETKLSSSLSTNDQLYGVYLGGMQENTYFQLNASYYKRKSYELSKDFKPTAVQGEGKRVNADKEQKDISLKAGVFVNDALHLATKVSLTRSEYGVTPNTQTDVVNPVFFAYTRIDPKNLGSVFLYLDYDLEDYELSARVYYDKYKDIYEIYKSPKYVKHEPLVSYDDSRLGTVLKAVRDKDTHTSSFVFLIEENAHQRSGGNLDKIKVKVQNISTSLSDIWHFTHSLALESGISYVYMKPTQTEEDSLKNPTESKSSVDGQLKLSYKKKQHLAYISLSQKSRMPTMEQMITVFPWQLSNPTLKPEESLQYALGYKYSFNSKVNLGLDSYYYDIKDLIVYEDLANFGSHFINRESALHYGGELRLNIKDFYKNSFSFSYAYAHTEDSKKEQLLLVPKHTLRLEDSIKITNDFSAFIAYSFVDKRYSLNSASYSDAQEKLQSYHLLDAQLSYSVHKTTDLRVGVKNILDENYEYNYGYPAEGRSFYFSIEVKL